MSKARAFSTTVTILVAVFMLVGCAGMSPTEQRVLSGGYLYDRSQRRY